MIGKLLKQSVVGVWIVAVAFSGGFYGILEAEASEFQGPFYADQDYITINKVECKDKEGKDAYCLRAETKALAASDWIVFVIRLNPDNFSSFQDLKNKSKDKRAVYESEGEVVDVLYAESKNFYDYFDFVSIAADLVVKKTLNTDFSDSATIPKTNDGSVYMIRAYSGGTGALNDLQEKDFVLKKVDEGQERHIAARNMNYFLSILQVVEFYGEPLFLGGGIDKKIAAGEGKAIKEKILYAGIAPALAEGTQLGEPGTSGPDSKDFWEMAYESTKAMMSEYVNIMVKQSISEGKKKALENYANMSIKNCGLAIKDYNALKDFLKATSVTQRYTDMALFTTPIETSYIMPNTAISKIVEDDPLKQDIQNYVQQIQSIHPDMLADFGNDKIESVENVDTQIQGEENNQVNEQPQNNQSQDQAGNSAFGDVDLKKLGVHELNDLAYRNPEAMLARLKGESKETIEYISEGSNRGYNVLRTLAGKGYAKEVISEVIEVVDLKKLGVHELNDLAYRNPEAMLARLKGESKETIEYISEGSNRGYNVLRTLAGKGYFL